MNKAKSLKLRVAAPQIGRPSRVQLVFTYGIVTPAIIGGYDNKNGAAQFRLASYLGALRFWWRALALSRLGDQNEVLRLQDFIFGSAAGNNATPVRLRIVPRIDNQIVKSIKCGPPNCGYPTARYPGSLGGHWEDSGFGLRYLANLGLKVSNRREQYERQALQPGGHVKLSLSIFGEEASRQCELTREGVPTIADAVRILDLCGGIGARSRRGFGSLQLKEVMGSDTLAPIKGVIDHANALTALYEDAASLSEPDLPYAAFSQFSQFAVADQGKRAQMHEFHNETGIDFVLYRSNGNGSHGDQRVVAGERLKPGASGDPTRFWGDHEIFVRDKPSLSRRAIFGLPHNYFSPKRKKSLQVPKTSSKDGEEKLSRRASPLFLTLREYPEMPKGSGGPTAIWTGIRSQFLDPSVTEIPTSMHPQGVPISSLKWADLEDFFGILGGSPTNARLIGGRRGE